MSILLGSPSLDFMYISASAPEAPPLSETTTGCFIRLFFWMADCIMRAIWSDAPPAPAATTISTGLFGSQATAGAAASTMASAAVEQRQVGLISGIASSLDVTGSRAKTRPDASYLLAGILPLCGCGASAPAPIEGTATLGRSLSAAWSDVVRSSCRAGGPTVLQYATHAGKNVVYLGARVRTRCCAVARPRARKRATTGRGRHGKFTP